MFSESIKLKEIIDLTMQAVVVVYFTVLSIGAISNIIIGQDDYITSGLGNNNEYVEVIGGSTFESK